MSTEVSETTDTSTLDGKAVIITGGGQGLGRAVALRAAAKGAKVIIADLNPTTTASVLDELRAITPDAESYVGDVSKPDVAKGLVDLAEEKFGGLWGLVNNAGITQVGTLENTSEADWDRTLSVNLKSMFLVTKYALPVLRKGGGGSIVNVCSISGIAGMPEQGAYAPSKGGVASMTQQLAFDYGKDAIRVNAVAPAAMMTPMIQDNLAGFDTDEQRESWFAWVQDQVLLKRVAQPREVASAVVFLLSEDASFVHGVILPVDGGWASH
ncbi:SDR family NAD(P)-dependent oxidoreductase [Parafrigoribacterium mesophilum]|uniref:SDR family NAD(P)-dependent oxidoreductase n=1 Tax=Parafrigoribacterium mesophilum TaxID=433646 RepID=UPI0031FC7BA3